MTDETRETLECALAYCEQRASAETMWPSCNASDLNQWDDDDIVEWVENLARWGRRALALRDVLTPRTCGNCAHLDPENRGSVWGFCGVESDDYGAYPFQGRSMPLDERCKGWQAREGEGGGK